LPGQSVKFDGGFVEFQLDCEWRTWVIGAVATDLVTQVQALFVPAYVGLDDRVRCRSIALRADSLGGVAHLVTTRLLLITLRGT